MPFLRLFVLFVAIPPRLEVWWPHQPRRAFVVRLAGSTASAPLFARSINTRTLHKNPAMPAPRRRSSSTTTAAAPEPTFPPAHDWRTTDDHERARRRARALEEQPRVRLLEPGPTIFGRYAVTSRRGHDYTVELRALGPTSAQPPAAACECVDFRINGLGTCKHVEAVLLSAARTRKTAWRLAQLTPTAPWITLVPSADATTLQAEGPLRLLPPALHACFDTTGRLTPATSPEDLAARLATHPLARVRLGLETAPWLTARRHAAERIALRRDYEARVQSGEWPAHETLVPLFPYQREGMLHLAFTERALLADEMGLGKTIQAIAACALLHRLGRARRVLIVTPASLKTEWEEQIRRFTDLSLRIVYGNRLARLAHYAADDAPFFTLVNYEQVVPDTLELNARLSPDIVVLDEAQRIKNWTTKTAQAVKRLRSRYAFVLTGTPLENRIDELYSLVDYLEPRRLRPALPLQPRLLHVRRTRPPRRLPKSRWPPRAPRAAHASPPQSRRRDRAPRPHRSRPPRPPQRRAERNLRQGHERIVAELGHKARRRPLLPVELDKLMRELAMMRMVCDTNFILGDEDRTCPKLDELEPLLAEIRDNPEVKVIIFSEWERMLLLVRELCTRLRLGSAWHTGSVPQQKRRAEINRFKTDPACRVFLSTDSGGVGLNLQHASVVINCDLPWNPAKLEQRIARAWRKHQTRAVTVINLVSADTIEHRMLATLADKRGLADGVLDRLGDLSAIKLRSGRTALLARLDQVMLAGVTPAPTPKPALPADPAAAFALTASAIVGERLLACEERYPATPDSAPTLVALVDRDAELWRPRLEAAHADTWKHAPTEAPRLLVLDRATQASLAALAAAGLITLSTAATRTLHPLPAATETRPAPLSPETQQRLATLRDLATRRLKAARALLAADLPEEAAAPAREALHALVSARALQHRWAEPADLPACTRAPWSTLLPATAKPFAAGTAAIDSAALAALAEALASN
jgi:hypothetical protein